MEHVLLPTNPEQILLKVPFISVSEHHGSFKTYLERNNVSESQLFGLNIENGMLPLQSIAHLQTWLYFGMLRELTASPDIEGSFDKLQRIFTEDNEGFKHISTRNLPEFWSKSQTDLHRLSSYEQDLYRYRIESSIESSNLLISKVDQACLSSSHQAIVLSIMLLNEYIMESADLRELELTRPLLRSPLVEHIMRDRRWCPSDIERMRLALDVGTLFFTAQCGAPPALREHNKCTRMVCQARQILSTEDYHPRHAAGRDCHCEHVPANRGVLLGSLQKSIIPVCRYHFMDDPPSLQMLESTQVSKYVAISHVWSDKLGNREANALPRCLLRYIQEKVDALYDNFPSHVAFWIDTISCPVEPDSATDQAIALMRETYAHAEKVLVLDQYLENVKYRGMTEFEQCLRIVCTGWTRRLWTLQEGILAKTIFFQFDDGAINGDDLFRRLSEPPIAYQTIPIFHAWMEIRMAWNGQLDSSVLGTSLVWMLYRALSFRTTSVSTDEALCLATITGVDLKEITKVKPEDRMKRFWELVPNVSTALLYWDGPRLNSPGLRWAPTSLLCASPESFMATHSDQITKSREVVKTKQGLVFCSPGVLLGRWKSAVRKGFWLRDEQKNWYFVNLTHHVGSPISLAGDTAAVGQLAGWDGVSSPPKVFALLLDSPLDEAYNCPQVGANPAVNPTCALVSIFGANQEPNYLSAVFESAGIIRRLDAEHEPNATGFSVPALAEVVERELISDSNIPTGSNESSGRDKTEKERKLRHFYSRMKPNADASANFIDDPDIDAIIEDDRLNIVVSEEHIMFDGRSIPSDQCFCLG
jgi:hypothetical protein